MIQGEGQGELRGISFTAQDRYGYNWIYGGNNKQWQPLSGDAEGTGKFLLTSGGNKGLNFDFNWYNGAISGQVVVNGSGASEISMSGTFNSEFGYRGTVRAYENP